MSEHLAAVDLLVAPIVTLDENVSMGPGRPLLVERCADLDVVDEQMEGGFFPVCIGDIANVKELIPPRELGL